MKVYGFDDADVIRGELRAAEIDAADLDFSDNTCAGLGREYMTTRFGEAQKELLARMRNEEADDEALAAVRSLKAAWIPLD